MQTAKSMDAQDWALLLFLSVLWGGSFFFVGVAVKELPPLTLVFARVLLAALCLLPLFFGLGHRLPRRRRDWAPFFVMGVLNNALPFTFIFAGQTFITVGVASIVNATTPLFTVLILWAFHAERLTALRLVGVALGLVGVAILRGIDEPLDGAQSVGIGLCLAGALSYGFSALWSRRRLAGVAPLRSATLQLTCSAAMMAVVSAAIDRPWTLDPPSLEALLAVFALAILSTALAYLVFFKILVRAGAGNVMLVTLLIPATAVFLGAAFLGEEIGAKEMVGALVIGVSLLFIDGRAVLWAARLYSARRRA